MSEVFHVLLILADYLLVLSMEAFILFYVLLMYTPSFR